MRPLFRILTRTPQLRGYYIGIMICSIVVAATSLGTPFLIARAVGEVERAIASSSIDGVTTRVVWIAVALLSLELVSSVTQNVGGYLGDVMTAKLKTVLSSRYFKKLLGLPQTFFDEENTGATVNRLNRSIEEVTSLMKVMANTFVSLLLSTIAIIVISGWYAWPLAVLLVVLFPTYLYLTALTSKNWQGYQGEINDELDLAQSRFTEVIAQSRVVKSFVREASELDIFNRRYESTISTTRSQASHWHSMDVLRRAALSLIFFGIYLLLFIRTAQGQFSLADMVLLVQLVARIKVPVEMMSWVVDEVQRGMAGSKSYFEIMALPSGADAAAVVAEANVGAIEQAAEVISQADAHAPIIEFDDVSFRYSPEGQDVLCGVSFKVAQGEKVALVSESGGGKSTLVSLLLGFYEPTGGTMRIAGREVSELSLPVRRALVAVVFQEAQLFSGTVFENIAFGNHDASHSDVVEASKRANAHDFIDAFDNKYETTIGERGLKLSGGQRQRIAVARAMIKNAPILILDEATSALDTKSERLVQAGLDELMVGRTSLIIAHRLSTISAVDLIITLIEGQVAEVGSPDELAGSGGIYSELLVLQESASLQDRARLKRFGIAV